MKIRILSGNDTGSIRDVPQTEAENAISTGYAELVDPKKDQPALDLKKADVPDPDAPLQASERPAERAKRKAAEAKAEKEAYEKEIAGAKVDIKKVKAEERVSSKHHETNRRRR
jgi:hypothetical protein